MSPPSDLVSTTPVPSLFRLAFTPLISALFIALISAAAFWAAVEPAAVLNFTDVPFMVRSPVPIFKAPAVALAPRYRIGFCTVEPIKKSFTFSASAASALFSPFSSKLN